MTDDREDLTELAGRVVDDDGRIVGFVTLSRGEREVSDATDAVLPALTNTMARELDGSGYHLVDGDGERVGWDA